MYFWYIFYAWIISYLLFIFLVSLLAIHNDILEQLFSFGNSFNFSGQCTWPILRPVPSGLNLDLALKFFDEIFEKFFNGFLHSLRFWEPNPETEMRNE